jgi:O-acetyl-ADP-ribose deacetylase (regulator of RNase III)
LGAQVPGIKTIAFCSISTGVFGFPLDAASRIALDTVAQWMEKTPQRLNVIFNVYSGPDLAVYKKNILEWGHD